MRKVSREVAQAFINGQRKAVANTRTDGNILYLHGNAIAKREEGKVYVTLAGWNTVTTRERVNTLLNLMNSGIGVSQKNYASVWHNLPIGVAQPDTDSDWVEVR